MKKILTTVTIMLMMIAVVPLEASAVSTPGQVKVFGATTYSDTSIRLTWKKPSKCTGYAIYQNGKYLRTVPSTWTAYNVPKLKTATTYKYTIKAYNVYKRTQYYNSKYKKWTYSKPKSSQWRGRKTRKVNAYKYGKASAVKSATTGPAKVTGLKSTAKTHNTTTIQWTKQTKALTGYVVYRNNAYYKTLGKNTNVLKVTGLKANTAYTYKVRSYLKVGSKNVYGAWSPNLKVTTNNTQFEVKADKVTQTQISLSWTNIANYYEVYRNGVYIGYTGSTSITDKGLMPNTQYTYYVTRYDTSGKEYKSNTITVKTLTEGSGGNSQTPETVGGNINGLDFEVVKTTYLDTYAGKRIYLGQKFSEVSSDLRNNADGTWEFTRPNEKVYLYNTNTYEDFLAVYVRGTQITKWISNSEIMGVDGSTTYTRTSVDTDSDHRSWKYNFGSKLYMTTLQLPLEINGGKSTESNEKDYEVHLVNAVRQVKGAGPVQRNIYLEGVDFNNGDRILTYSGKTSEITWVDDEMVEGIITVTNARFGAQAQADACKEQGKWLKHDAIHSSVPPNVDPTMLAGLLSAKETGNYINAMGENAGIDGCVENCVAGWTQSAGHFAAMCNNSFTQIGVGIRDSYYYQWFAKDPEPANRWIMELL